MVTRVLHVIESMEPEAGSVAIALAGLMDALRSQDVGSEVVAVGDAESVDDSEIASKMSSVNLVHFHGWGSRFARTIALQSRAKSKPYVVAPLGGLIRNRFAKRGWRERVGSSFRGKRLVRQAAALIAVNATEAERLPGSTLHSNVISLPYGLNVREYDTAKPSTVSLPTEPKGRLMLMLCPVHPVEGIVPMLLSLSEMGSLADEWSIVVAGPEVGDWRRMLDAAIRRKGATDRVLFTGASDVETQRAWLAKASLLVAFRMHIGAGTSVLQAAACGVPVIASNQVAPSLLNGAIQVCPTARHELKRTLRKFFELSDSQRDQEVARAKQAVQRADWSVLVEDYLQLYRGLC